MARTLDARLHTSDSGADLFSFDAQIDAVADTVETSGFSGLFHRFIVKRTAKKELRKLSPLSPLVQYLDQGGVAELLRMSTTPTGEPTALFHYYSPQGGLGYIELVVAKIDGVPRFVDFIPIMTCERHVRAVVEGGMSSSGKSGVFGEHAVGVFLDAERMTALNKATAEGRWADAMAAYDALSPRLQNERAMMTLRFTIATKLGEPELSEAVAALRASTTNPRCAGLLAVDPLFTAGQYAEVLQSIDIVDTAVGGDPLLDVLRIAALDNTDRGEEAEALRARLRTRFPVLNTVE